MAINLFLLSGELVLAGTAPVVRMFSKLMKTSSSPFVIVVLACCITVLMLRNVKSDKLYFYNSKDAERGELKVEFAKEVESLVAEAKTREAINKILRNDSLMKSESFRIKALVISARYNHFQEECIQGVNDSTTERNQINKSILSLISRPLT